MSTTTPLSVSLTISTSHRAFATVSAFRVLLQLHCRLGCAKPSNSYVREVPQYRNSMSGTPGISTGSGPAATLFIPSGARPLRLATAAIIASLLSVVYPLGRSPFCKVVSAVLTIWGRLGTYLPRLLPVPYTLISAHPRSHSSVERCSSRCCSVIDLPLSKRSPGSGILHSSVGPYMNAPAVFTAT